MFSKIIHTFVSRFASAGINFLILVLLSRVLGASVKGEVTLVVATVFGVSIVSGFLGGSALVFLVPRCLLLPLLFPAYVWAFLVGVASFVYFTFLPLINPSYTIHIVLLSFVLSIYTINQSLLLGKNAIKVTNLLQIVQICTTAIILILFIFVFKQKDLMAYVWALYVSFGLVCLWSCVLVSKYLKTEERIFFSSAITRRVVGLSFYNQWAYITQFMSLRLSFYWLEADFSLSQVGVYSNSVALAESVWLVSGSVSTVLFSQLANNIKETKNNLQMTIQSVQITFVSSLFLVVAMLLLPEGLYIWLFGNDFSGIKLPLYGLSVGVLVYACGLVLGHYFSGVGLQRVNALASSIGLVATLLCGWVLIPTHGQLGASLTASISFVVSSSVLAYIFMRREQILVNRFFDFDGLFRRFRANKP